MSDSLNSFQHRVQDIITDAHLNPKQKSQFLALEAEANLPYLSLSEPTQKAMKEGILCDLFEGHAPFKPRYVLPDYAKYLIQGSEYLELEPAKDFDDAINLLTILYHHVPSVTGIPVYLGHLDEVLMPYVGNLDEEEIYQKLKRFWIMLDRTLPDAFMHVNIGPTDNVICRTILKIDVELKQVAPNLTFMYDPKVTPDDLLRQATSNICACSKPHIANYPIHAQSYGEKRFGIVSCYNSLPLAGGSNTLVRLNLKLVANLASGTQDFLDHWLPYYSDLMVELMDVRSSYLHEKSHFFDGFLTQEGLIEESRFAPMFGIYGMAEAVNVLMEKAGNSARYGHNDEANQLSYRISDKLADIVDNSIVKYGIDGKALLHAQGGIALDKNVTPGVRIPYGTEPDPVTYVQATAKHHKHYTSGISDILTIDETVKSNPEAMFNLCKGALDLGFREFTANVASNDLVRVTGYMIKLSDIEKFSDQGSRKNTTWLGAEAANNTGILQRAPRVVSMESQPVYK
ncbi:glycine radical enzyme, YjjI family protein [Vibrio zhanjiangensis]|uniref:Glycine radical enzyme, YjjI family protein n=1 Tax=Vibrio zhanjiangensis TaxID=1046128 RepID=A0ABQ6EW65_9VIBR|nr:YjjI family glycine radical enzyme [Vibrio zhanjiangensis]GLT16830.1 glycine radical enzyme, YjjI family protein [Vibrio zhanjiangensis]